MAREVILQTSKCHTKALPALESLWAATATFQPWRMQQWCWMTLAFPMKLALCRPIGRLSTCILPFCWGACCDLLERSADSRPLPWRKCDISFCRSNPAPYNWLQVTAKNCPQKIAKVFFSETMSQNWLLPQLPHIQKPIITITFRSICWFPCSSHFCWGGFHPVGSYSAKVRVRHHRGGPWHQRDHCRCWWCSPSARRSSVPVTRSASGESLTFKSTAKISIKIRLKISTVQMSSTQPGKGLWWIFCGSNCWLCLTWTASLDGMVFGGSAFFMIFEGSPWNKDNTYKISKDLWDLEILLFKALSAGPYYE